MKDTTLAKQGAPMARLQCPKEEYKIDYKRRVTVMLVGHAGMMLEKSKLVQKHVHVFPSDIYTAFITLHPDISGCSKNILAENC